jgi:hypothetical protein
MLMPVCAQEAHLHKGWKPWDSLAQALTKVTDYIWPMRPICTTLRKLGDYMCPWGSPAQGLKTMRLTCAIANESHGLYLAHETHLHNAQKTRRLYVPMRLTCASPNASVGFFVGVTTVGFCLSPMWVASMCEETTTYQSSIQIFIIVIQNIRTNFSLKICRLLVEEGLSFARLALRVSPSLSVCW